MHLGLLGNRESWYVAELTRAARARGHQALRLDYTLLSGSEGAPSRVHRLNDEDRTVVPLDHMDAVIVRTMPPGSLEQVVFRMDLLASLQAEGTLVVNPPRAIECAVDKYLTTARLSRAGLPVPRTTVCQSAEAAWCAFEELGGDVVVKPLFGAEGRGIVRVSDPDLAWRTFRALERLQAVLYLQEFIPHEGFDVRVLVLGGTVLGGMTRRNPHDFRTNLARAATAEPHIVTPLEQELSLSAAASTEADFAGVDLLYDRAGRCYVIEVNAVPGWRGFQRTGGIDVADRLLAWIEGRLVS